MAINADVVLKVKGLVTDTIAISPTFTYTYKGTEKHPIRAGFFLHNSSTSANNPNIESNGKLNVSLGKLGLETTGYNLWVDGFAPMYTSSDQDLPLNQIPQDSIAKTTKDRMKKFLQKKNDKDKDTDFIIYHKHNVNGTMDKVANSTEFTYAFTFRLTAEKYKEWLFQGYPEIPTMSAYLYDMDNKILEKINFNIIIDDDIAMNRNKITHFKISIGTSLPYRWFQDGLSYSAYEAMFIQLDNFANYSKTESVANSVRDFLKREAVRLRELLFVNEEDALNKNNRVLKDTASNDESRYYFNGLVPRKQLPQGYKWFFNKVTNNRNVSSGPYFKIGDREYAYDGPATQGRSGVTGERIINAKTIDPIKLNDEPMEDFDRGNNVPDFWYKLPSSHSQCNNYLSALLRYIREKVSSKNFEVIREATETQAAAVRIDGRIYYVNGIYKLKAKDVYKVACDILDRRLAELRYLDNPDLYNKDINHRSGMYPYIHVNDYLPRLNHRDVVNGNTNQGKKNVSVAGTAVSPESFLKVFKGRVLDPINGIFKLSGDNLFLYGDDRNGDRVDPAKKATWDRLAKASASIEPRLLTNSARLIGLPKYYSREESNVSNFNILAAGAEINKNTIGRQAHPKEPNGVEYANKRVISFLNALKSISDTVTDLSRIRILPINVYKCRRITVTPNDNHTTARSPGSQSGPSKPPRRREPKPGPSWLSASSMSSPFRYSSESRFGSNDIGAPWVDANRPNRPEYNTYESPFIPGSPNYPGNQPWNGYPGPNGGRPDNNDDEEEEVSEVANVRDKSLPDSGSYYIYKYDTTVYMPVMLDDSFAVPNIVDMVLNKFKTDIRLTVPNDDIRGTGYINSGGSGNFTDALNVEGRISFDNERLEGFFVNGLNLKGLPFKEKTINDVMDEIYKILMLIIYPRVGNEPAGSPDRIYKLANSETIDASNILIYPDRKNRKTRMTRNNDNRYKDIPNYAIDIAYMEE